MGITEGPVKRVEILGRQSRKAHTIEHGSASGFVLFWTVITQHLDNVEGFFDSIDTLLVCGVVKGKG